MTDQRTGDQQGVAHRLRTVRRIRQFCLFLTAVAAVAFLPFFFNLPYLRHLLVIGALNVGLALSFDLLAGHIGAVSLAHPAFFGVGAYAAAIMSSHLGASMLLTMPAAMLLGALLAVLFGVPLFRLSELSFAIGTLG